MRGQVLKKLQGLTVVLGENGKERSDRRIYLIVSDHRATHDPAYRIGYGFQFAKVKGVYTE